MNTAMINGLIEYPFAFFLKLIAEPLAGAALAYYLVWLAMRPKDGRKVPGCDSHRLRDISCHSNGYVCRAQCLRSSF
jgi:hypothetical protein